MEPKQKTKGFSLKLGLLGILIICWVFPVIMILGSLIYYNQASIRGQLGETVRVGVSGAAASLRRGVHGAVESSRRASYDRTIITAYRNYLENRDLLPLYHAVNHAVTPFLQQNYRYDNNFMATMVFFHEEPDKIFYTFRSSLGASYSDIQEYQRDAHEEVVRISGELDTGIAFLNANGKIYMARNLVDSRYRPYATIVSEINSEIIFGGFMNIGWEKNVTIYLNGTPVSTASGEEGSPYISFPEELNLFPGEQWMSDMAGGIVLVYGRESTDAVDIRYAAEIETQDFLRGFFASTNIIYTLALFIMLLLPLAVLFFYRNIFKPIDNLTLAAGKIQSGALGYRIERFAGNREFNYLTEAFNGMSAHLKQQFESNLDLTEKVTRDPLTGIYNRRFMEEALKHSIKTLSRSGSMLSVMMIDVDFFKKYNDTYGHGEGDACLKKIAETLSSCVTREDDFVARYGGEEFIAVFPNTGENGVHILAKKILERIRGRGIPHETSEAADCITVSIGVVTARVKHTHTNRDYIEQADEALYKSKKDGRNRYTCATFKEAEEQGQSDGTETEN